MRNLLRVFLPVLVVLLASSAVTAQTPRFTPTDDHVFNFGRIPRDFAQRVAANGGEVVRIHHQIGVAVARGLTDEGAAQVAGAAEFARDLALPLIPSLDDRVWSTENTLGGGVQGHDPTTAFFFPFQWDMQIIDADLAWNAGFRGHPSVSVAVLDSGIDPFHLDLAGLVDASRSAAFVGSLTGPPAWVDDNFHGTHVAGTIATNGIGTSGVAPHTTLIAVKVCNVVGSCPVGAIIGGIVHAASVGADVINMSLGGSFLKNLPGAGPLVAAFNRAVNFANRNGVLVVSAAGNAAVDLDHNRDSIVTPCESGAGICVSSTGPDDLLASYSNSGTSAINVAAPGGDFSDTLDPFTSMVLSPCTTRSALFPLNIVCAGGNTYLFLQGTSMAAPHVSGAAALLDAQFNGGLNAAQLKTRLQQTADDLGKKGADADYGKGRINVCTLVSCQ